MGYQNIKDIDQKHRTFQIRDSRATKNKIFDYRAFVFLIGISPINLSPLNHLQKVSGKRFDKNW